MGFTIDRIDHVVVNCRDVSAMAEWYVRVLGLTREAFGPDRRIALKFGAQKLNLRPSGAANWATGAVDAPGSLDFCFITADSPDEVVKHFAACGVAVETGPVTKTGALGTMISVYCRDPEGNLVEVASYPKG